MKSVQVNPNQVNPNQTVVNQVVRKPRLKTPNEETVVADTFEANGFSTKKTREQQLQAQAAKGGKIVDVNGETRIERGGDWFRPYVDRNGYDENFLGEKLPMPTVDPSVADQVAPRLDDPGKNELEYTNFSVVMNKERRMPFYTAVNIDGSKVKDIERSGKWLFDARMSREYQLGNEAYKKNDIDKGHMVRRRDPAWGDKAEQGSEDTFVYTNAALQHSQLNQDEWLDLEDRILHKAEAEGKKVTVMTGPVFADNDPSFNNNGMMDKPVKIPQDFWKVVVWKDPEKGLQSEAFVMSQKKDLAGQGVPDEHLYTEQDFATYRVPISKLEEMTKLRFGALEQTNDCGEMCRLDPTKAVVDQIPRLNNVA